MYLSDAQNSDLGQYTCSSVLAAYVSVAVGLTTLATVCVVLLFSQPETHHTRIQAETHARR